MSSTNFIEVSISVTSDMIKSQNSENKVRILYSNTFFTCGPTPLPYEYRCLLSHFNQPTAHKLYATEVVLVSGLS